MTYNNLHNEGGEGYTPNRLERQDAERAIINADLDRRNAAARADMVAKGFVDADATAARRAEWNARVKSGEFGKGKADMGKVNAAQAAQGWTIDDLKYAMHMYGIA